MMKSFRYLYCSALLAMLPGIANAQTQSAMENHNMEQSQIEATIDANSKAVAAGDIESVLETYAPDAVMVGPAGPPAIGTPALRAAFSQFLAIAPQIKVTNSTVVQSGDTALNTYAWTMTGKTPDGQSIQQSGLSVIVLRKQSDGRWLMVIDNPFADKALRAN